MAQIINENPGLGALLGTGLGSGLGGALDQLAQLKMANMVQRQQSHAYQKLGLPSHLADALAQISPQERFDIFQRLQPEDFATNVQPDSGMQALQQGLTQPMNAQQSMQQAIAPQQESQQIPLLARPSAKQRAEQVKAQRAEQAAIDKSTQKFYDETLDKAESAKTSNQRLEKMSRLIEKGGLPVSTIYNVLKGLEDESSYHGFLAQAGGAIIRPIATILRGIERQAFPSTEEFEKLSNDFIKEAKPLFGARLTDADLRAFMQTIPTLSQSDSGKKKIIRNIELMNKGALAKADALKKVIKENGGKRPYNVRELVEEKAKPELDRIAKEFID